MKTFKHFFRYAALAVVAMFATVACSTDDTEGFDWLDQPFAFDISYSTGEAVWDKDKPETLVLNKLGIGMTGTVPYLKIKSNTYWTISVPDDCDWLRLALTSEVDFADAKTRLGGPTSEVVKTDDQITNVYLKLKENFGDTQNVELKFTFSSGLEFKVPVSQKGALTSGESSVLTFLKDGFGTVNGEDVRVKFYSFSTTVRNDAGDESSKHTYEGVACAGDATGRPFSYAGSETVYVSDGDQSEEYNILTESNDVPASGGANIRLVGNSYFDIRVFNNQGKSDFQMLFGAKNEDGRYRTKDLKVWVSKDGVNWDIDANANSDGSIAYDRLESISVNGWAVSRAKFSIVPGISDILYFRFENTSSDTYRIDDILVEEYEGETDQIFSLIQTGSDVIGLPVTYDFTALAADNLIGQYWRSSAIILSKESGVYDESDNEEEIIPTVPESTATSSHLQFIMGGDASLVKTRTDATAKEPGINGCGICIDSKAPAAEGMMKGDYWLWTIPVHNVAASTNVKAAFTFNSTSVGPKYYLFQWAQCTESEYKFAKQNIMTFSDEEKHAFYETLDWKTASTETIDVPNDVDKAAKADGIPIHSASSPKGYWKGEITYSKGFAATGSDINIEYSCNFPEAMDDGYFFIRLKAAEDLTASKANETAYQRMNSSTNHGRPKMTKTAAFTFDGCGQKPEYDNSFRVLVSYNNFGESAEQVSLNPKFIAGDNAVAGVYAGSTGNIPVTTQGNNILSGSCEIDESGNDMYLYSPYNASSSNSVSDVVLGVPTTQTFDDGYLVASSVPLASADAVSFKTTNTMRAQLGVKSAVLELSVYVNKMLNNSLSKIEISTLNPDDLDAPTTNIAGSYHYDILSGTRGEGISQSHTIVSNAVTALKVSDNRRNALKLYFGLLAGSHKLYVKFYIGSIYYLVPIEVAEYADNKITSHEIIIDEYPSYSATDELTGINSVEQFRQFCQDVKDGKTGSALDQYRNVDGELGFGGAVRDEDKVIDMAGVDIYNWPLCTLKENFNGGNYVIKNLVISNKGRDLSEDTSVALFKSIEYGCTISNITFDESCKMELDLDDQKDLNFAFLMLGDKSTAVGNFYNIVNYGTMDFSSARGVYNTNAGALLAYGICSKDNNSAQSTITSCKNYGKMYFHDIRQTKGGSGAWNGYHQIGGIIGVNMGMIIEDCENHGDIVMENIDRHLGSFYVGGIAGYNCNRDGAISLLFGLIKNCSNYGEVSIGQDGRTSVFYTVGVAGIVGRMQWANLERCSNYADFKVKATVYDPWAKSGEFTKTYPEWAAQIVSNGNTNSLGYFSIGGIFAFCQNNIATATSFANLSNAGNIYVECDMDGKVTYADNTGISVGGITGRTGANAYNPHFEGCANMGNITLKSNVASAEAFVGGICGHFAGNQYTDAYLPYCQSCSNNGTVSFVTDNPADVIAHAGGICGAAIYGRIISCVNAGEVNNASTNEASHIGSILGTQHRSTITKENLKSPQFLMDGNAVGGVINGQKVNQENYVQYLYGGYETYEPYMAVDKDGKNTNYYFNF